MAKFVHIKSQWGTQLFRLSSIDYVTKTGRDSFVVGCGGDKHLIQTPNDMVTDATGKSDDRDQVEADISNKRCATIIALITGAKNDGDESIGIVVYG